MDYDKTKQARYVGDISRRLSAGFLRFQKQWFCDEHNIYEDLKEGQHPLALVIACSDSRVDPVLLTDSRPGDLFVIRNVANLVPPYSPDKKLHGVSAAMEYGVRHLGLKDIIVMGHANCGGVHTLLESTSEHDEFISIWMQIIKRAKEVVDTHFPHATESERLEAYEQWGIRVSLENLMTFPWIRDAVEIGEMRLHGWYFDLHGGKLLRYNEETDLFESMVESCFGRFGR